MSKVSPGNSGASVTMIRMLRTPGHCLGCGRQLIPVVRCRLCPPSGLCSESPDRRFPVRGGWAVCSGLCHGVTLTAAGLRLTAPAAHWPVLCTALTVHSTLSPSRPVLTQQPGRTVSRWSQSQTRAKLNTKCLSTYICKICSSEFVFHL